MSVQTFSAPSQAIDSQPELWSRSAGSDEVAVSSSADALLAWQISSAALALWKRMPPIDIAQAIAHLPLASFKGWHLTTHAEVLEGDIRTAMSSCGVEHDDVRRYLTSDMIQLAGMFVAATGHQRLEVRFDIVKDNACRRFHTDSYPERLAVTYRGPGTVTVPSAHAEDALKDQEDYSGPILEIPQFWAALFAGKRNDRAGIVHRSPQIAGTRQTRLFFCVNAVRS